MEKEKDLENNIIQMEIIMKGNGKMDINMEKEKYFMKMGLLNMKVNGYMVKEKDMKKKKKNISSKK